MIIDTGASGIVIPTRIADDVGLRQDVNRTGTAYGAGGVARFDIAATSLITVGDIGRLGSRFVVDIDSDNPDVLIGDAFLFEHDLEIDGRQMNVLVPVDCDSTPPAYGDEGTSFAPMEAGNKGARSPVIRVLVNGRPLRALVDTGAPISLIDLRAADALGVDPVARNDRKIEVPAVGTHRLAVQIPEQPFDQVEVGGERIRAPRIAIADLFGNALADMGASAAGNLRNPPDMILGADFLSAHRILFAWSQGRMYLSYTGGPVFGMKVQATPVVQAQPAGAR